ncbi:MAG: metal-dependent transcriptional regulator [Actinomyces succiniciruminis]|uniref:Iron-dependent repressor IdeR n=1 Tax=Actinomyces succiniciruminis TaxID=1522002 RepID=A0A1L7RCU9_9ACTO|nr:metal-dependent transcriptional regulator [Actinomyces succiniciruminis]MBE6476432.1 metal-dependent transcriptional regulator [Actinomyces succiniciruminis]MBM6980412.1 metal-dependent transcriptional regulator [Actinomyces succiniciruminis]CED91795.1 Iron-dependent repressor IdeR [Actinomyces succiniciruminis]
MSELIDTTEMYLKSVYELEEDGVLPLRARIVERLGHSGPTVSQTVARMERSGLIWVADDRSLQLTDEGRRRATEVIRKHRLAERLLLDVIGLDRRLVHDEACRWEHVMSEQVEDRLAAILGEVTSDPFGNPVPDRVPTHPAPANDEISAERLVRDGRSDAVVSRVGEPIQADDVVIAQLEDAGIGASTPVRLTATVGGIRVSRQDDDVSVLLPSALARHLFLKR